ncbi:MAG: 30S ribosomal protein S21 [Bacteroidetes bacterium RIFCSPLOWO2_02_FULL_36_8]|nr:MAG: 30S ribosomal protein S21 [Bacteroidetes bacterium RIFCSPLOWO2_02_FULL_36_8]OFY71967.1 MAG: 30S ribosomal protein S21 [Bacteroidetes bacterium RIFCSPLOWO2_12_FULL_37_12]
MLIVEVKNNESLDKALRRFKKKFEKTGVLREIRSRSYFQKDSITKRQVVNRAKRRQELSIQEI